MEQKTYSSPVKQADDQGALSAVFATLNVIDKDGAVTVPGAFGSQTVRVQPYGHDWHYPAIGKGQIREEGERAIFEGRLNLDMEAGRETWQSLKFDLAHGTPLQEWSYIFDVVDSRFEERDGQRVRVLERLRVHSVDPVFLGAGIDTRTLAVKALAKSPIASHSTDTSQEPWDVGRVVAAIPNDAGREVLRAMAAWVDTEGDADVKASYKFWHHFYRRGSGPASLRACSAGIAVLNGGRGGADIPDRDRRGVWNHLARHLRDAGREPPELASRSLMFAEHLEAAAASLADVAAFVARARTLAGLRKSEGRGLRRDGLDELLVEIKRLGAELDEALAEPQQQEQLLALWAQYQAIEARIHGVPV